MSTSIDYVVDCEATLDEAPGLAQKVVDQLLARGIILPTPQSHAFLTNGPRYATGPNVAQVADFNDCFPCGLDIVIGRQIYTGGDSGIDSIQCPTCNSVSPLDDDLLWDEAIGEWSKDGLGLLNCPSCGAAASVADWRFEPTIGFGNVAFKFSEWMLREEFVQDLNAWLGHRVVWVKCHI